ncbi:MAG: hypothetical protein HY290_04545 [Planctomycetia bacterium]|nr:hypothetical protein [Planctomycetia bacterium]
MIPAADMVEIRQSIDRIRRDVALGLKQMQELAADVRETRNSSIRLENSLRRALATIQESEDWKDGSNPDPD